MTTEAGGDQGAGATYPPCIVGKDNTRQHSPPNVHTYGKDQPQYDLELTETYYLCK